MHTIILFPYTTIFYIADNWFAILSWQSNQTNIYVNIYRVYNAMERACNLRESVLQFTWHIERRCCLLRIYRCYSVKQFGMLINKEDDNCVMSNIVALVCGCFGILLNIKWLIISIITIFEILFYFPFILTIIDAACCIIPYNVYYQLQWNISTFLITVERHFIQ